MSVWAHPELRAKLQLLKLEEVREAAFWEIDLENNHLKFFENRDLSFKLSHNLPNLKFIINQILQKSENLHYPKTPEEDDIVILLDALIKENGLSGCSEFLIFWQSLLNSFSLQATLEAYFSAHKLHGFSTGLILIHPKGETNAWQMGPQAKTNAIRLVSINNFNSLFQSLKKTKNRNFSSSEIKWSWLPLNGVFVADVYTYKKFNVIWINSREEFLPLTEDDFSRFSLFSKIIQIWLERLIELEFSDIKSSDIMWLIEHLPFDLTLRDKEERTVFTNTHFSEENSSNMSWISLPRGYKLGFYTDTEFEDFEIDVFQKQKMLLLGDLFNTLRHELSNPLFGLKLTSQLVLSSVEDPEFNSIFKQVITNIQRSQDIIHNLSRLYSGEQQDTSFELEPIIKESITLAKSELKGVRVDFLPNDQNSKTVVEAKSVVVLQIIFNLIVNAAQALKSSTTTPKISLGIETSDQHVIVRIHDNGPGLPQTIRENLFKPFYTTKNQGHGLGLALSKDLASKIDGDLVYVPCESGCEFNLYLKRAL